MSSSLFFFVFRLFGINIITFWKPILMISNESSRDDLLVDIFLGKFPAKQPIRREFAPRTRHPVDGQGKESNWSNKYNKKDLYNCSRNYRDASSIRFNFIPKII